MSFKKSSLFVVLFITFSLQGIAFGGVPAECQGIELEGNYDVKNIEDRKDEGRISFSRSAEDPAWFDVAWGQGREGYSKARLIARFVESEKESLCHIDWYNPRRNDHEFNMILQRKRSGTLLLGGDFETRDLYLFIKRWALRTGSELEPKRPSGLLAPVRSRRGLVII